MDNVPIFKSQDAHARTALHIGVELRYETNDAEGLLHFLRFLEAYAGEHCSEFRLMPTVTHNGTIIDRAELLGQFEKIPEDNMRIRGVIGVHFLDEMQPVFAAYLETLRRIKSEAEKEYEWDETHPFFITADFFEFIASRFFPDRSRMN